MINDNYEIRENSFSKEQTELCGNKYLIANGFMGCRGTLEEFRKEQLTALNIAGLYDLSASGGWRESVNAPNPFYTVVYTEKAELSVLSNAPVKHNQTLDIRYGIHKRCSVFEIDGIKYTVESERFISMDNENICALRYSVSVDTDAQIRILTGFDTDIWDINGKHLTLEKTLSENFNSLHYKTVELGIPLVCFESIQGFNNIGLQDNIFANEKTVLIKAGQKVTFDKICGVYWGNDVKGAKQEFSEALKYGYDKLLFVHKSVWDKIWDCCDVRISGDDTADLALRYSLYHLNSIAPRGKGVCGIPARGLSGQVYKGASFWDTEMFMLPFFSFTQANVAKKLAQYRVNTLDGAKRKAEFYGYNGAFYAWESQETGDDACSDFNVTDVFTGRPQRTYFKDKQIHISADVVYGIWEYSNITGDDDLLINGGLKTIYECVLFLYAYAVYKPMRKRFELIDTIGPDEYHERVSNNFYTNKMAKKSAEILLMAVERVSKYDPDFIKEFLSENDISWVKDFKDNIYVKQPLPDGVIEQFDGYFKLEDISLDELKKRILKKNEYLGGYGLASTTRIIKQADTVMTLNVFRNEYDEKIKKANWDYYEPYTEHGSSLSACAYAIVASSIGYTDWAYNYFLKTATVDLTGDTKQYIGTIYIGGTHPAANGGSWNTAIFGFGGVSYSEHTLDISPKLPLKWEKMSFKLLWKGVRLNITVSKDGVTVIPEGTTENINVTVNGKKYDFS